MSVRMSARRKAAFLKALRASGNQALAAERAKVSRRWVSLHRSTDPDFKRESDAAIAEAAVRLSEAADAKPASGWGFLDGAELVVRGSGGAGPARRVQIARARVRQWSPRIELRFLGVLAGTCNVQAACAAVGMSTQSAYRHRLRWPAFERRWHEAIENGYARIEVGLVENACNLFSAPEVPLDVEMPGMTAAQALQLLHLHKHHVHGLGKRPGLPWRRSIEDTTKRLEHKMRMMVLAESMDSGERERDLLEWAKRRRAGETEDSGESAARD